MKVAVVTDSGSNIYHEGIEMEGLYRLPLQISDGDRVYLEGENITTDEIYQLIKDGKMLKTSLPPLGRIESLFTELKHQGYDSVFAVPICTGLSSTLSAMISAAQEVGIDFDYVDCYSTAYIELHLAMSARILFNEGKTVEEVKERLTDSINHSGTYIIPNDLNHLARGGRLSPLSATLAGLLKIKPILFLDESTGGKIDPLTKTRTMGKAIQEVVDLYVKKGVGKGYKICIAHVWNPEAAQKMFDMMKEKLEDVEIYITDLISTVGIHTGIGCLATEYIKLVDIK